MTIVMVARGSCGSGAGAPPAPSGSAATMHLPLRWWTEKANVDPAECPLLILRLLTGREECFYVSTMEVAAVGA